MKKCSDMRSQLYDKVELEVLNHLRLDANARLKFGDITIIMHQIQQAADVKDLTDEQVTKLKRLIDNYLTLHYINERFAILNILSKSIPINAAAQNNLKIEKKTEFKDGTNVLNNIADRRNKTGINKANTSNNALYENNDRYIYDPDDSDFKETMSNYRAAEVAHNYSVANDSISIDCIFTADVKEPDLKSEARKQSPKYVIMYGKPGIGKSTICQQIVTEWANGKLWQQKFEWVILFSMRDFNYEIKGYGTRLGDMINAEIFSRSGYTGDCSVETLHKLINKYIKEDVLFIIDGYDELLMDSPFAAVINNDLLSLHNPAHVLVTARPGFVPAYSFDRTIHISGFSYNNMRDFIKVFFKGKPKKEETLLDWLKSTNNVANLASIPIMLGLICSLWDDDKGADDLRAERNPTFSKLYMHLMDFIWERYTDKYAPPISSLERKQFNNRKKLIRRTLQLLALTGANSNQFIFDSLLVSKLGYDLFKESECLDTVNDFKDYIGLLIQPGLIYKQGIGRVTRESFSFLHRTLQEFLAANEWTDLFNSDNNSQRDKARQIFIQHRFDLNFEVIWWFAAGILSKSPSKLEEFIQLIRVAPKDLVRFNEFLLMLRCLEECEIKISDNLKNELLPELANWLFECGKKSKKEVLDRLVPQLALCYKIRTHPVILKRFLDGLFSDSIDEILAAISAIKNLQIISPNIVKTLLGMLNNEKLYKPAIACLNYLKNIPLESIDDINSIFVKTNNQDILECLLRCYNNRCYASSNTSQVVVRDCLSIINDVNAEPSNKMLALDVLAKLEKTVVNKQEIINSVLSVFIFNTPGVRTHAAITLAHLAAIYPEIENIISESLYNRYSELFRETMFECCGLMARPSAKIIKIFKGIILNSNEPAKFRQKAASIVFSSKEKIKISKSKINQILLALLQNVSDDFYGLSNVIQRCLSEMHLRGGEMREVLNQLTSRLENDDNHRVKLVILMALNNADYSINQLLPLLLGRFIDEPHDNVAIEICSLASKIIRSSDEVLSDEEEKVILRGVKHQRDDIKRGILKIIRNIKKPSINVINMLIQVLVETNSKAVKIDAIETFAVFSSNITNDALRLTIVQCLIDAVIRQGDEQRQKADEQYKSTNKTVDSFVIFNNIIENQKEERSKAVDVVSIYGGDVLNLDKLLIKILKSENEPKEVRKAAANALVKVTIKMTHAQKNSINAELLVALKSRVLQNEALIFYSQQDDITDDIIDKILNIAKNDKWDKEYQLLANWYLKDFKRPDHRIIEYIFDLVRRKNIFLNGRSFDSNLLSDKKVLQLFVQALSSSLKELVVQAVMTLQELDELTPDIIINYLKAKNCNDSWIRDEVDRSLKVHASRTPLPVWIGAYLRCKDDYLLSIIVIKCINEHAHLYFSNGDLILTFKGSELGKWHFSADKKIEFYDKITSISKSMGLFTKLHNEQQANIPTSQPIATDDKAKPKDSNNGSSRENRKVQTM